MSPSQFMFIFLYHITELQLQFYISMKIGWTGNCMNVWNFVIINAF